MRFLNKYFALLFIMIIQMHLMSCNNTNASNFNIKAEFVKDTARIAEVIKEDSIVELPIFNYSKNELLGIVKASKDSNFIKIDRKYTAKSDIYLRKATYLAYCRMYAAAKKDGVSLNIISAFRSNYHQKLIWESKWTGKRKVNGQQLNISIPDNYKRAKEILKYSSMPGSSRHHWGTDIDIYDLNNSTFENGQGLKVYNWLVANAVKFGFYQVYTADRNYGYYEEKWHWSFLEISKPMLDAYKNKIVISDFNNFKGSQTAEKVKIIEEYVLGINKACL